MPMRRWMRHTDRWMPSRASASCQASTWWYTLSMSVPSRSKRNAGAAIPLTLRGDPGEGLTG